jgi:hypothetical protein
VKTLSEIAIEAGLVNRAEVTRAGRAAELRAVPLVVALIREAGIDELALLAALRKATRVKGLDPANLRPDPDALRMVPRDLCHRHRILPVNLLRDPGGGRVLRIAMADPTDATALAEVEQVAGCELEVLILPLSSIEELADQGYRVLGADAARQRRPFGEGMKPSTQPHARREVGEDTALTPSTVPFHSVADEADLGLRLRALVRLLEAKGVLADGELETAVIDLMRAGRGVDPTSSDED